MTARRRGHKAPKGYDPSDYPQFAVTVDVVILTIVEEHLQVVLVRRRDDPYKGMWALPGGFKRPDETLKDAAARELLEETGVEAADYLSEFAIGDPARPRMNVVTVGFLAVLAARAVSTNAARDSATRSIMPSNSRARMPTSSSRSERMRLVSALAATSRRRAWRRRSSARRSR